MGTGYDDPVLPVQVERAIRRYADRLDEIIVEHRDVLRRVAEAEADHNMAYHSAHLESTTLHPERKVAEHETFAKLAAESEYRTLVALQAIDKSLKSEAHSLRAVLSSYQTLSRMVADEAGLDTYGKRRP